MVKGKNKKAGFEMSITTIVVLVIAVIMLIMGLFLVRTIMCGGIGLAKQTLEGAQKEIENIFTERGGEIVCIGETKPVTAIPGDYNFVACGFNPKKETTYDYKFDLSYIEDEDYRDDVLNNWILGSLEGTMTVEAGDRQSAVIKLYPPKNADEMLLTFELLLYNEKTGKWLKKSEINVKVTSVGWARETIC